MARVYICIERRLKSKSNFAMYQPYVKNEKVYVKCKNQDKITFQQFFTLNIHNMYHINASHLQ